MGNGRRFRRGDRVPLGFGDPASPHDCPVCRALGQRVEEDGQVVDVEGASVDLAEAWRLLLEHGEVL